MAVDISTLRALIGDQPIYSTTYSAIGDAATIVFRLVKYPVITSSFALTVNGAIKTVPADYTLNSDSGTIRFVSAPPNGATIAADYSYAQLSDESLGLLGAISANRFIQAALAAESLATRYAQKVSRQIGDKQVEAGSLYKQFSDMAKEFRSMASLDSAYFSGTSFKPFCGGISHGDQQTALEDTDRLLPAFSVGMHDDQFADQVGGAGSVTGG